MSEYTKQASAFLSDTGTTLSMQRIRPELAFRPAWASDDKVQHGYEYRVALIRGDKDYRFSFWDSIHNAELNKRPTAYDILAALMALDPATTLDDFISDFGYQVDSVKGYRLAEDTYKASIAESKGLRDLYSESELEQLAEIN